MARRMAGCREQTDPLGDFLVSMDEPQPVLRDCRPVRHRVAEVSGGSPAPEVPRLAAPDSKACDRSAGCGHEPSDQQNGPTAGSRLVPGRVTRFHHLELTPHVNGEHGTPRDWTGRVGTLRDSPLLLRSLVRCQLAPLEGGVVPGLTPRS